MSSKSHEPKARAGVNGPAENGRRLFWVPGLRPIAILLGVLVATLAATRIWWAPENKVIQELLDRKLPVLGQLPPFSLKERSGKDVALADLAGRVWVADFFFTRCSGPCPKMSAEMAELQRTFKPLGERVRLVSISVDPGFDTPQVLVQYAKRFGADPAGWWFVTGEYEAVQRLAIQGFKLGATDNILIHSEKFVLVDAKGRIRGYYESSDVGAVQRLVEDAWILLNREAER